MTVAVSVAPIATLLIALVFLKMKAWQAALAALSVSIAAAISMFPESLPLCRIPGVMLAIVLSSRRRISAAALARQLYAWAPFGFVVAILSLNSLTPAEIKRWTTPGALGGFVTGSGTSSCVLFGRLQADVARELCVDPRIFAAANVMGAGIGKMICPQSIAIGVAAASLSNREGIVLRKTSVWFLIDIILATAVVSAFAF